MENKDKDELIKLFKAFINNKDVRLENYWYYSYPSHSDNTDKGFIDKKEDDDENQFIFCEKGYDYNYYAYNNKRLKRFNYSFNKGEKLKNTAKKIALILSKHPPMFLSEYKDTEEVEKKDLGKIHGHGFWSRGTAIVQIELKQTVERYIKFGSLEIELTETEFNALYQLFKTVLKTRANELDRELLQERIEEYGSEKEVK